MLSVSTSAGLVWCPHGYTEDTCWTSHPTCRELLDKDCSRSTALVLLGIREQLISEKIVHILECSSVCCSPSLAFKCIKCIMESPSTRRKVSFTTFRKGARKNPHSSSYLILTHLSAFCFFKSGFIFTFGLLANGSERKPIKHAVLSYSLEAIPFTLDQSRIEPGPCAGKWDRRRSWLPACLLHRPVCPGVSARCVPGCPAACGLEAHHLPGNRKVFQMKPQTSRGRRAPGRSPCDTLEKSKG